MTRINIYALLAKKILKDLDDAEKNVLTMIGADENVKSNLRKHAFYGSLLFDDVSLSDELWPVLNRQRLI